MNRLQCPPSQGFSYVCGEPGTNRTRRCGIPDFAHVRFHAFQLRAIRCALLRLLRHREAPAGTEQRVICTVPLSRAASPVCVSHTSQQTHPSEDLMIPPGFTCTLPFSAQRPKLSGGREWNRRRVSSRIGCLSTPTADSPAVGGASKKRRTMMAKARITILKQTFQADILEREIRDEAFRDSSSSYPSFGKGRPRSPKTGRPCPTASANEHGRTFDRRLRW